MSQDKFKTNTFIDAFVPSLTNIIFVVVFILALVSGSQMLSIDSDLGRHLTIGNYILNNHIIPTRDLFSHTLTNQSRPPYEWLSQILFAVANYLLGLDGVILLTAVVIATTFTLVFQFTSRRSQSPIIAFLTTLLAIGASSLHWLPRPHIITFLFLTIWIERLEQVRNNEPIKLFVFPLLMMFWSNLHGGFVFGILTWLAYIAGWLAEKWQAKTTNQIGKRLLLAGLFSLIATTITPVLWRNWEAVLNNRSSFILSRTVETMPPNLTTLATIPFTLLFILTAVHFLTNRKILPASHFFLLTGLGAMSLSMARNIPLFAIACAPILGNTAKTSIASSKTWKHIEERFAGFSKQTQWHAIPLAFILLTIAYITNIHINKHQSLFQFDPQVFPVQAMDWLEANPQSGKMFNEFNWGGYILYRAWPRQQVFLDSQSDFYGEALMKDYEQIMTKQKNRETLLEKYQADWVIIPTDSPLSKALSENQNWEIVYEDTTAIIIRKHH